MRASDTNVVRHARAGGHPWLDDGWVPASAGTTKAGNAGFTLLEVMAALVIVSLGMLGVIEAIGQTASNSSRMRDRTLAHWVAMNKLTSVRLEQRAPKIDKSSDEVEMAGRRWRWTMEVSETPVQSLRRIDIRVAEAEANEEASLASVTGFYGSAISTTPGPSVWQSAELQGPPGSDGQQQPPPQQPTNEVDGNGQPSGPGGGEPVDPPPSQESVE